VKKIASSAQPVVHGDGKRADRRIEEREAGGETGREVERLVTRPEGQDRVAGGFIAKVPRANCVGVDQCARVGAIDNGPRDLVGLELDTVRTVTVSRLFGTLSTSTPSSAAAARGS